MQLFLILSRWVSKRYRNSSNIVFEIFFFYRKKLVQHYQACIGILVMLWKAYVKDEELEQYDDISFFYDYYLFCEFFSPIFLSKQLSYINVYVFDMYKSINTFLWLLNEKRNERNKGIELNFPACFITNGEDINFPWQSVRTISMMDDRK